MFILGSQVYNAQWKDPARNRIRVPHDFRSWSGNGPRGRFIHRTIGEVAELRPILLECRPTENIKWGKPRYGHEGRNVVNLQEMKSFLSLMFFKGALMGDPEGVLEKQGPNSRSARRIRFTSAADVVRLANTVKAYVGEAIHIEKAGKQVGSASDPVPVAELQLRLDQDPALKVAFEALTLGCRRECNLYFSGAKQAKTSVARVEKCVRKILDGKGLRDR